jgi:hypothetical protein
MNIIYTFVFAAFVFASVIISGLWLVFWIFPMSKPGKTFFRIFVDGDYDGNSSMDDSGYFWLGVVAIAFCVFMFFIFGAQQ